MSDEKKRAAVPVSPANWSKKTKRLCLIWVLVLIAVFVLAAIKPGRTEMAGQASQQMQKLIKQDQGRSRKARNGHI